jgi:hypothetical protein
LYSEESLEEKPAGFNCFRFAEPLSAGGGLFTSKNLNIKMHTDAAYLYRVRMHGRLS